MAVLGAIWALLLGLATLFAEPYLSSLNLSRFARILANSAL
jgi:hypothetical protein